MLEETNAYALLLTTVFGKVDLKLWGGGDAGPY